MFEPFAKYEMFTWQQGEILHAVKDAVSGKKSRKISIRSGH
jgi:hypothetical protein